MRIGVIEAVSKDHPDKSISAPPGKLLAIDLQPVQSSRFAQSIAVDPRHRQNAPAGHPGYAASWKDDGVIVGKITPEDLQVAKLASKIQLIEKRPAEFLDQRDRLIRAQHIVVFRGFGQKAKDVQVASNGALDARMLDFHDHLAAALQACAVDLSNRRRSPHVAIEGPETFVDRSAQLVLDSFARYLQRIAACAPEAYSVRPPACQPDQDGCSASARA